MLILRNYKHFLHYFCHTFTEKLDRFNLYANFSGFLVKTEALLFWLRKIKAIIRY